jgi:hypothetical protein
VGFILRERGNFEGAGWRNGWREAKLQLEASEEVIPIVQRLGGDN